VQYSFDPFTEVLEGNWFDDDPLLRGLLDHYAGAGTYDAGALSTWGQAVAGPLRELAEASAGNRDLPRVEPFDPWGRRIDRILLPDSTREALAVVAGRERLGALHGDPFIFYARGYLCGQNGEAGVVCSLGCTDGMVRALEALGDRPVHREAVDRIRGSTPARVWHGAQFVTEVQGGSDVPANRTEAVPAGSGCGGHDWRLSGRKWFCSNVNADYYLVTARPRGAPEGGKGVALFLVPAHLEETDARRNGHRVDRLKEKLGTRELATAEITFDGALAYPVGPLDRGLANLVRHVLTTSRFYCVQSAASTLRQAERLAGAYAGFRTAFGRRLTEFPLARERLEEIRMARRRALACYFELLRMWEEEGATEPEGSDADEALHEASTDFRILMSLCKPVLTAASTRLTREAMMLLGGNGIEERFSPLPRLYRDAVIMEIWEGPHDVLFTQALRDLRRFRIDPEAFVRRVAGEGHEDLARRLARVVEGTDGEDPTVSFRRWAPALVEAFADRVLEGVEVGLPENF
jgi:alkylation response protein AidB-like acyl-CoA dehydrogenase